MMELENALENIKWDILELQVIRRNFTTISERKSKAIFCHGSAKRSQYGVGFLIKNNWKQRKIYFKCINERIPVLMLELKHNQNLKIINVHAPTSEGSQEIIEEFYNDLENVIEETDAKTQKLLLGDFNATVGRRQIGEENTLGSAYYGKKNARGDMFVDFANRYNSE